MPKVILKDLEVTITVVSIVTCGHYIAAHPVFFGCFGFFFFAEESSEGTKFSFLLGLFVQGILTAVVGAERTGCAMGTLQGPTKQGQKVAGH